MDETEIIFISLYGSVTTIVFICILFTCRAQQLDNNREYSDSLV